MNRGTEANEKFESIIWALLASAFIWAVCVAALWGFAGRPDSSHDPAAERCFAEENAGCTEEHGVVK